MADDRQNSESLTVASGATESTTGVVNSQGSGAVTVEVNGDSNAGDINVQLDTTARSGNGVAGTTTPSGDHAVANKDATGAITVLFPVYGATVEAGVTITNNGASSTTVTVDWEGN